MMTKQGTSIEEFFLKSTFQYYTVPFIYIVALCLVQYFENPWVAIWLIYTFIPILDEIFTMDLRNPTKEESKVLESQLRFKLPLYVCVFLDWFNCIWMLNYLTTQDTSLINIFGVLFLSGNLSASNINVAHELFHKDDIIDKTIGTLTLTRNLYTHFVIEHLFGHHRHVSTPHDPASSKLGQTLFQYLPQTLIGSYKSAWNFEAGLMMAKHGRVYGIQNRMLWYTMSYFVMVAIVYNYYGLLGTFYYMIAAFMGIIYLETVNYIEHYGLARKEISPGVYEPVDIRHSWNAPHRLSNYLLFKLQRHSDHHENPYKPYQILCSYDQSPQLPHGYTVCVILAWFPNAWFDIMDESIERWKANLKSVDSPITRKKIHKFIFQLGLVTTTAMVISLL